MLRSIPQTLTLQQERGERLNTRNAAVLEGDTFFGIEVSIEEITIYIRFSQSETSPSLPRVIPIRDLDTDKDTDHNDAEIYPNREPVLIFDVFCDAAQ